MDITKAILYIHPTFKYGVDFEVRNDSQGEGDYIVWLNEEVIEPTQAELEAARTEYCEKDSIVTKAKRIQEIEQEIRSLGTNETTSTFLSGINNDRIIELRNEKEGLESQLDSETEGLEQDTINDIISAIFS